MSLFSLFMTSMLDNNIILTKFLGVCPFIGVSQKEKNAIGMGLAVIVVLMISSIINYTIFHLVLVPTNSTYLRTMMFILVIASMTQIIEIIVKSRQPKLHQSLGIFLPLIATNCAILGINLLNINNGYNFLEMLIFTLGSGVGYILVIYLFSTMRERMDKLPIPKSFKGIPIALITASIMSVIFSRYFG